MRRIVLGLIGVFWLASGTAVSTCFPGGPGPLVAAEGHYVAIDTCPLNTCVLSVWVYQETNGIDGLQRQDAAQDDTCDGSPPDTVLASVWRPL